MVKLDINLCDELLKNRFAVVSSEHFILKGVFDDFIEFINSYNKMKEDPYYGNENKAKRSRRYSDFNYNPVTKELSKLEHKNYYQSKEHNEYVGGIKRDFEDFEEEIINNLFIRNIISNDFEIYKQTLPKKVQNLTWQCQLHQIRIEIEPNKSVELTPEMIHCDGYPFSGVHLMGKKNVDGARSKLYLKDETVILDSILDKILDTVYFYDRELLHYVTTAHNKTNKKAFRQILAVSFSLPNSEYDIKD